MIVLYCQADMAIKHTFPSLLDRLTQDIQTDQTPYRVLHIYGVLQSCMSLGAIYGLDKEKLAVAALLHDCAKNFSREETLKLADQGLISLLPEDMEFPAIWHGAVAAYIGRSKYKITDEDVLQAVENHTVGCKNPTKVLQVLMCADFCEPTRQHPHADRMRRLVRQDLSKGLLTILNLKIEDLAGRDQKVHSRIYSTIESLES